MNIYPEQLKQVIAYCEALNKAEEEIGFNLSPGLQVNLQITVTDEDGVCVLGTLVDEVGGAWSFEMAK